MKYRPPLSGPSRKERTFLHSVGASGTNLFVDSVKCLISRPLKILDFGKHLLEPGSSHSGKIYSYFFLACPHHSFIFWFGTCPIWHSSPYPHDTLDPGPSQSPPFILSFQALKSPKELLLFSIFSTSLPPISRTPYPGTHSLTNHPYILGTHETPYKPFLLHQ